MSDSSEDVPGNGPEKMPEIMMVWHLICPFCAAEFPDEGSRVCPTCGHNCEISDELKSNLIWARIFTWLGLLIFPAAIWTPFLTLENLGGTTRVSLITGIETLLENGDHFLAAVIVLLSGVLPLLKSLGMLVLTSSSFLSTKHSRFVYSFVEFTSKFAMIDVFVSGFSIMLFKTSPSFYFEAQPGILVYSCMVLCNLIAAMRYDTRVLGYQEKSDECV